MNHNKSRLGLTLVSLILVGSLSGCVSNTQDNDPFEGVNRFIYNFNDGLDKNFIKPAAEAYVKVTPKIFRTGVTNFFDNVGYVNVIANDVLQGKIKQAWDDTGRFIVNSTIGIGGLFDPASGSGLVKHDEDLGQTFGKWGFGEGAYLVLPLFGPNSIRDAPDLATSAFLSPLYYASATITFPLGALNAVNKRANYLEATRILHEAALDPYSFTREAYRQSRQYQIYDGNPPNNEEFYEEGETGVLKVY